jgi:hypothetical protein
MNISQFTMFMLLIIITSAIQAHGWGYGSWWQQLTTETNVEPTLSRTSNLPPSISGNPPSTATVGEPYNFRPIASDPENDPLSFSISNLPEWAYFDLSTGLLNGTPDSSHAGLFENILISVTDGTSTTSLTPFQITVNQADIAVGSATLSWAIPTTRTNGSPLAISEILGYRIYMGNNQDELSMLIDLQHNTTTSYSLTNLPSGIYYFTVTTYDYEGNESPFSNIATKQVL